MNDIKFSEIVYQVGGEIINNAVNGSNGTSGIFSKMAIAAIVSGACFCAYKKYIKASNTNKEKEYSDFEMIEEEDKCSESDFEMVERESRCSDSGSDFEMVGREGRCSGLESIPSSDIDISDIQQNDSLSKHSFMQ